MAGIHRLWMLLGLVQFVDVAIGLRPEDGYFMGKQNHWIISLIISIILDLPNFPYIFTFHKANEPFSKTFQTHSNIRG